MKIEIIIKKSCNEFEIYPVIKNELAWLYVRCGYIKTQKFQMDCYIAAPHLKRFSERFWKWK